MFNNILIPVSSEYYSKEVLKRGVFLAQKFKSKITLIYIIEEKTLKQADKLSDAYRTHYEIAETKKEIIKKHQITADSIIFEDAKIFFKNKGIFLQEKIIEGEYSTVVKNEVNKQKYDSILMGFEKECLLNYRLLDNVDIPIWIESGGEGNTILAVCSNLAPNKKVPSISLELAKTFGWKLEMIYVVDTVDSVEVDEKGSRSDKKPEKLLIFKGQKFIEEMKKKGIKARLVKGSLERETAKAAEAINANLVIIGRQNKKKKILGLPMKSIKRRIAEKCDYSILFIN